MANFSFELRSGDVFLRITAVLRMAITAVAEDDSEYSNIKLDFATTTGVSLRSCHFK